MTSCAGRCTYQHRRDAGDAAMAKKGHERGLNGTGSSTAGAPVSFSGRNLYVTWLNGCDPFGKDRLDQQEAVKPDSEAPEGIPPEDSRPQREKPEAAKPERRGRILSRLPFRPSDDGQTGSFEQLTKLAQSRNSKLELKDLQRAHGVAGG